MPDITSRDRMDQLLSALGEQLASADARYELVVIGGSGLLALGIVERATRDVDIVALRANGDLSSAEPLPEGLRIARDRVARDFSLPADWLNPGPTDLLSLGLPEGFTKRLERRDYGEGLVVYLASRYDQIHFKLYALVDQGPGKHEQDLRALSPAEDELITAARWTRSHDPSEGYAQSLRGALTYLGVEHADLGT
ncbi:MAG TPA: DUF6036 family nucleotidyltransferase [Solirubrobacterales bacterium]|nr:DUF6036 family nucleotidyltransferase [Solirubrobacterales bacterium]